MNQSTAAAACLLALAPALGCASSPAPAAKEPGAGAEAVTRAPVAPSTGTAEPMAAVPSGLTRSDPVVCVGADSVAVDHVYVETDADGVIVRGSCKITIKDSVVVAGRYALLIQGNGDIVIEGSRVEGKTASVAIPGTGMVRARTTKFKGYVSLTGGGDVVDGGGNTFE